MVWYNSDKTLKDNSSFCLLSFFLGLELEFDRFLMSKRIQQIDRDDILSNVKLKLLEDKRFIYSPESGVGGARAYLYRMIKSAISDHFKISNREYLSSDGVRTESISAQKDLGSFSFEGKEPEFSELKLPMISESLRFGGMNPERGMNNPKDDNAREYLLCQYKRLQSKLETGKIIKADLLNHLSEKFPQLEISHLLEDSWE